MKKRTESAVRGEDAGRSVLYSRCESSRSSSPPPVGSCRDGEPQCSPPFPAGAWCGSEWHGSPHIPTAQPRSIAAPRYHNRSPASFGITTMPRGVCVDLRRRARGIAERKTTDLGRSGWPRRRSPSAAESATSCRSRLTPGCERGRRRTASQLQTPSSVHSYDRRGMLAPSRVFRGQRRPVGKRRVPRGPSVHAHRRVPHVSTMLKDEDQGREVGRGSRATNLRLSAVGHLRLGVAVAMAGMLLTEPRDDYILLSINAHF